MRTVPRNLLTLTQNVATEVDPTDGWGAQQLADPLMNTFNKFRQLGLSEKEKLCKGSFNGLQDAKCHAGDILWAMMSTCAEVCTTWRDSVHASEDYDRHAQPTVVIALACKVRPSLHRCDDDCSTTMAAEGGFLRLMGRCGDGFAAGSVRCEEYYDKHGNKYANSAFVGYHNQKIQCQCGHTNYVREQEGVMQAVPPNSLQPNALEAGVMHEMQVEVPIQRETYGNGNDYLGVDGNTQTLRTMQDFLDAIASEGWRQSRTDAQTFGERSAQDHKLVIQRLYALVQLHFGGELFPVHPEECPDEAKTQTPTDPVPNLDGPFAALALASTDKLVFDVMQMIADALPLVIKRLKYWSYRLQGVGNPDGAITMTGPDGEPATLSNLLWFAKTARRAVDTCQADHCLAITDAADLAYFRATKSDEEERQRGARQARNLVVQSYEQEGDKLIKLVKKTVGQTNKRIRDLVEAERTAEKRQCTQTNKRIRDLTEAENDSEKRQCA